MKKALSILLAVVLVLGCIPFAAMATETNLIADYGSDYITYTGADAWTVASSTANSSFSGIWWKLGYPQSAFALTLSLQAEDITANTYYAFSYKTGSGSDYWLTIDQANSTGVTFYEVNTGAAADNSAVVYIGDDTSNCKIVMTIVSKGAASPMAVEFGDFSLVETVMEIKTNLIADYGSDYITYTSADAWTVASSAASSSFSGIWWKLGYPQSAFALTLSLQAEDITANTYYDFSYKTGSGSDYWLTIDQANSTGVTFYEVNTGAAADNSAVVYIGDDTSNCKIVMTIVSKGAASPMAVEFGDFSLVETEYEYDPNILSDYTSESNGVTLGGTSDAWVAEGFEILGWKRGFPQADFTVDLNLSLEPELKADTYYAFSYKIIGSNFYLDIDQANSTGVTFYEVVGNSATCTAIVKTGSDISNCNIHMVRGGETYSGAATADWNSIQFGDFSLISVDYDTNILADYTTGNGGITYNNGDVWTQDGDPTGTVYSGPWWKLPWPDLATPFYVQVNLKEEDLKANSYYKFSYRVPNGQYWLDIDAENSTGVTLYQVNAGTSADNSAVVYIGDDTSSSMIYLKLGAGKNANVASDEWRAIEFGDFSMELITDESTLVSAGFTSSTANDPTRTGVSMRKAEGETLQALRYKNTIDADTLAKKELAENGYTLVEYGSIAMRAEFLDGAELVLTDTINSRPVLKGVAFDANTDIRFANNEDGSITFTAALYNIGKTSGSDEIDYTVWGKAYTVRAYALFRNAAGAEVVVYGEEASASVFDVMDAIQAGDNADDQAYVADLLADEKIQAAYAAHTGQ